MSYDLGVWFPQNRISNEEATGLYVRLCDGDTSGVVSHAAIDAFYSELTDRHPEMAYLRTLPTDLVRSFQSSRRCW
jgi:hypothetical protein